MRGMPTLFILSVRADGSLSALTLLSRRNKGVGRRHWGIGADLRIVSAPFVIWEILSPWRCPRSLDKYEMQIRWVLVA